MLRNGWSASAVATVSIGASRNSASSPPNMRCAERFIHSMPAGPTMTMPTSTESRIARVRRAIDSRSRARVSSCACCAFSRVTSESTAIASSPPAPPPTPRTESENQR